jgi:ketosteroid isomerase-like protein
VKRLIAGFLLAADTRKMTPPFHDRIRKVCPLVAATLIIPALAISFALPTFAQEKDAAIDPQIVQQLHAIDKKADEAFLKGDAASLAALFTEDAVLVNDTGPVYDREAIEKHYADVFKNVHFSNHILKLTPHVIGAAGYEVWINGEWSQTVQGKDLGSDKPNWLLGIDLCS